LKKRTKKILLYLLILTITFPRGGTDRKSFLLLFFKKERLAFFCLVKAQFKSYHLVAI